MSEQYDLKKSEEGIGQLYPILEAKDGEIIDGLHREQANKNWKRVRLEHIDTEEKKLVARLIANFHRRIVPYQEKKDWINDLARIYQKQGLTSTGNRNEIKFKISEVTGLDPDTVLRYLNLPFKTPPTYTEGGRSEPKIPASSRIEHDLGKEYVERHREEVKSELLEDEKFLKEAVLDSVRKSPKFREIVTKAIQPQPQIIKPSEPCPSGVCELPPIIEAGEPVDVMAESLAKFWKNNPQCQCKTCEQYGKCGVIR